VNFLASNRKTYISHGFTYTFENFDFSKMTQENINNSESFIKLSSSSKNALQLLSQEIQKIYSVTVTPEKLIENTSSTNSGDIIGYNNSNLTLLITVSVLFFSIFLFVWLVDNNRKIVIYRLNGVDNFRIANRLFLKEFISSSILLFALCQLFIINSFSIAYTIQFSLMFLLVLAITYSAISIVSSKAIVNQVNEKSFFKYSHLFLYGVKILVFIVSISSTMSIVDLANKTGNSSVDLGQQYGVLSPMTIGDRLNEIMEAPLNSQNTYEYGERNGALYVSQNPSSYLDGEPINDVAVNLNYLDKFGLMGENGQKIHISDNSSAGVVLVSEKLKSKLTSIKQMYSSADLFQTPKILYYFIKDDQSLNLLDSKNSKTRVDIVEVYNEKNAGEAFTSTVLNSSGLKFKIDKSTQDTYKQLLPSLKKDGVDSNFPSFIPINEMNKVDFLTTVGNKDNFIITNGLIFLIFGLMVIITTTFYIKVYKKKVAIKRLQGLSFLRTYQELFFVLIVQYSIFYVYSLLQANSLYVIEAFCVYFVVELVVILTLLYKVEKVLLLSTLKGE